MPMSSVNKIKLTKRVIESMSPDPTKRSFLWDTEIIGFHVRIYPTGRKTYFLQYRNQSRLTQKVKIGTHGNITTEQAREKAKQLALEISIGEDPAFKHKSKKIKPSIADLVQEYLELHAKVNKRLKSLKDDKSMISSVILPKLGSLKLEAVTSHDLQKLHRDLKDKPYLANRVRSLLSKMFNLAKEWGWRSDNPALNVEKYQEEKRDRWLNDEELQKLWNVLDQYPLHLTSYVFKLLILTGARKGELLNATWDQFDLEKGVWTKPSHLTKQKRREHLPLSNETLEVLKSVKRLNNRQNSSYLFPGRIEGDPLKEIKTFWRRMLKEANLANVRVHDLRHTHAAHLVSSGLSLSIVGKLLGHTQASTTQRYAHLADEPLRQATGMFGAKIGNFLQKNINELSK